MSSALKLLIAVAIPVAVGLISAVFTFSEINGWYAQLKKPSWNPPNALFGPVWSLLYILMGIALWLIWKSPVEGHFQKVAFFLFAVQLLLNFCWSFIFFNQHWIGWALVEVVLLWLSILFCIFAFARVSSLAAWLLVPYISWVSFATLLNYNIWRLNG